MKFAKFTFGRDKDIFHTLVKYLLIFGGFFALSFSIVDKSLDLTDIGYHLANQMNVKTQGLDYIAFMPVYWFSDMVAAGISEALGGWTLIQMRIFVLGLSFLEIVLLLRGIYFLRLKLSYPLTLLVMLSCMFTLLPFNCVLLSADYYSIPNFVGFVLFLLLADFFTVPAYFKAAALAAVYFLLLNLRISMGIMLVILPGVIAVFQFMLRENRPKVMKQIILLYGLIAVFGAVEYFYFQSLHHDIIARVFSGEWRNEKTHNAHDILQTYLKEFLEGLSQGIFLPIGMVVYALDCSFGFGGASSAPDGRKNSYFEKIKNRLHLLPYYIAAVWMALLYASAGDFFSGFVTVQAVIVFSYVIYFALIIFLLFRNRDFLSRHAAPIMTGGVVPLGIFAGTNTGIIKITYALPLLIVVVYLMLMQLPVSIRKHVIIVFTAIFAVSLGILLVRGGNNFYENIAISSGTDLTYQMQEGRIKGTYTHPRSGRAIDELLREIAARTKQGDKIFTTLAIPMIHFASDRSNVLDDMPNYDLFLANGMLKKKLARLCASSRYTPALIVRTKKFVVDPNWSKNPEQAEIIPSVAIWDIHDNAVLAWQMIRANCYPRPVWENDYFQILLPQAP